MRSGAYIPYFTLIVIPLAITIAFSAESIVDYYRDLPLESLKGHRYRLELKGKEWVSRSCANYEIRPWVDIKEEFLRITDKGTGGGVIRQDLALFRALTGPDPLKRVSAKIRRGGTWTITGSAGARH